MLTSPNTTKPIFQGDGFSIYNYGSMLPITGTTREGSKEQVKIDYGSVFYTLSPWEKEEVFRKCHSVFTAVTQQAQLFSAMSYTINPSHKIEDKIVEDIKKAEHHLRWANNTSEWIKYALEINKYLKPYSLRFDTDNFKILNFDEALLWFRKDIRRAVIESSQQVADWVYHPYDGTQYQDFAKEYLQAMKIHGANAILTPSQQFDGYRLYPAGSVFEVPQVYMADTNKRLYIQMPYAMNGWSSQQDSRILTSDFVSFGQYIPSTSTSQGMTPLDALVTLVTTELNTDLMIMEESNFEKPPQWVVFVVDDGFDVPNSIGAFEKVDMAEIERTEEALNAKKKDKAVKVLKSMGKQATPINIGKEAIIPTLQAQLEKIESIVYRAFGSTPNEQGQQDGSALAKGNSEAQRTLYYSQAINPVAKALENQMTYEVIKNKFGCKTKYLPNQFPYWQFELQVHESDMEKYDKAQKAMTLPMTLNEIRTTILGLDPDSNEGSNRLAIDAQPQTMPDNNQIMNAVNSLRTR